jgi:hypothetical protein
LKKDWKYIVYLAGALVIYLAFALSAPRELDWRVTLSHDDKIPFGAYAFGQILPSVFEGKDIKKNNVTIYETMDSLNRKPVNFISLSQSFSLEGSDLKTLLDNVSAGGYAFISANNYHGTFADTLKISTNDYFFMSEHSHFWSNCDDSSTFTFVNRQIVPTDSFKFPRKNVHDYITVDDQGLDITVIAQNDVGLPVTIRVNWGKGAFILNSTPLAFSNIYLLDKQNHQFATTTLSHLPLHDVIWSQYFQEGRLESRTPLRFILGDEALRWAYYIMVISLLVFILFEAKRRQRIIPIITPVQNTTLEFVQTIGDLYFQSQDHKNIAEKKISYFMEHLRVKYWLAPRVLDEPFINSLARKSGKSEKDIRALIDTIQMIQNMPHVNEHQLIDLNRKLEIFYEHQK